MTDLIYEWRKCSKFNLWSSFNHIYFRMTSENVAEKFGITREEQDKFALLSQQRLVPGVKCQRSMSTLLHKLSWQVKLGLTVNFYS